ncbi:MAG: ribosome small subunit-dependent GTPase A [Leptolyngbyaceae cyanobacterium SM2_3_12]|nr:ribosome small subunit-dependent GTPase A [Leptolyngbyaceae cyanobacterium SM2_3_12]
MDCTGIKKKFWIQTVFDTHLTPSKKLIIPMSKYKVAFIGRSNVGKSSLINQLIPQAELRTGAVSGKLGRGRHTTRHVELFELPQGGFLADTPGFNQPELALTPFELARSFPEIHQRLAQGSCQFNDCLHRDEPGCIVGSDWDRYELYRILLGEALALQTAAHQRGDAEATFKIKMGETGQVHHEPMLTAKKYRRPSRRSQKQTLDELRSDWHNSSHGLDLDDEPLAGELPEN